MGLAALDFILSLQQQHLRAVQFQQRPGYLDLQKSRRSVIRCMWSFRSSVALAGKLFYDKAPNPSVTSEVIHWMGGAISANSVSLSRTRRMRAPHRRVIYSTERVRPLLSRRVFFSF